MDSCIKRYFHVVVVMVMVKLLVNFKVVMEDEIQIVVI